MLTCFLSSPLSSPSSLSLALFPFLPFRLRLYIPLYLRLPPSLSLSPQYGHCSSPHLICVIPRSPPFPIVYTPLRSTHVHLVSSSCHLIFSASLPHSHPCSRFVPFLCSSVLLLSRMPCTPCHFAAACSTYFCLYCTACLTVSCARKLVSS